MKGATSYKFPCHNNAKKIYSGLEQRVHVGLLANRCRMMCSINSIIGNHPTKRINMGWLIRRYCRARVLILCIYSLLQNATPKNCLWLSHFYDIKSKNHWCTHNQPTLTPFKDIPLQSCFCCTFTTCWGFCIFADGSHPNSRNIFRSRWVEIPSCGFFRWPNAWSFLDSQLRIHPGDSGTVGPPLVCSGLSVKFRFLPLGPWVKLSQGPGWVLYQADHC